jgi:hypothetical protein
MNLHNIAAGYVSSVNNWITGSYRQSIGCITVNFVQTPAYAAPSPVQIQKQALTYLDLKMVSGLNINGEICAMYCNGLIEGVSRPEDRGGDLITLLDGSIWLVVRVLENWNTPSGWTKFAVVRQNGQ